MDTLAPTLIDLGQTLAAALQTRGWQLACAESCTGGLIAATCTGLSGSSAWFSGGFVTYSNQTKTEWLGVPSGLIARHGAVSEAVAQAMARGALHRANAQVALAVTGIAGPGGGSPDKPVGTVCLAWAWQQHCIAEQHRFAGERDAVRQATVERALRGLLTHCLNT